MPKTSLREWTETGPDGKPVTMIEVIDISDQPKAPTNTLQEITEAIAIHKLALVTAIRDSHATWGEGRIRMLIETIAHLEKMEARQ
jgi:hypothetical protein